MKVDNETVRKMAHLARIECREDELISLSIDMAQILTWMEKLQELNTDHVEPLLHMTQEINRWREDQVQSHLEKSKAMDNAPQTDRSFFMVPKVVRKS